MAKTHYAHVDRGNESDPMDYWSDTACGLKETESPLEDKWRYVTCKKCLKVKERADKALLKKVGEQLKDRKLFPTPVMKFV